MVALYRIPSVASVRWHTCQVPGQRQGFPGCVCQRTDTPSHAVRRSGADRQYCMALTKGMCTVNKDTREGQWQQLAGLIKTKWGKLTDDDLMQAEGNREVLLGKLHERYGLARDVAEKALRDLGHA